MLYILSVSVSTNVTFNTLPKNR